MCTRSESSRGTRVSPSRLRFFCHFAICVCTMLVGRPVSLAMNGLVNSPAST